MSLGAIREPGIVFGDGKKRTRHKASRRAAIARWAMANRDLGDDEIAPRELTSAKVRALRTLVADSSDLALHCDVLLCRLKRSDGEIALAISVIVDAINARVRPRGKES
jgi:hypothetical protein